LDIVSDSVNVVTVGDSSSEIGSEFYVFAADYVVAVVRVFGAVDIISCAIFGKRNSGIFSWRLDYEIIKSLFEQDFIFRFFPESNLLLIGFRSMFFVENLIFCVSQSYASKAVFAGDTVFAHIAEITISGFACEETGMTTMAVDAFVTSFAIIHLETIDDFFTSS